MCVEQCVRSRGRDSFPGSTASLSRFPGPIQFVTRGAITGQLSKAIVYPLTVKAHDVIVQELCESRGGRPGLSVLTSLLVSVDVKLY